LLAEAISSAHDVDLATQPLPLIDALARVGDRTAQHQVVVAYWRLAIAQAEYHFCRQARDRIKEQLQSQQKNSASAESQLAEREAAVDEAKLAVVKAGGQLASLIGLDANTTIPWAVDRPHVGKYGTKYERLFDDRSAPPKLRLLHRTLPLSRVAIDGRCAAVLAANDAIEAMQEDARQGANEVTEIDAACDRLAAQQRAFLKCVLRYNEDIAEYVFQYTLTVATNNDPAWLAARLIVKPTPSMQSRPVSNTPTPAAAPDNEPSGPNRTFLEDDPPAEQPLNQNSPENAAEANYLPRQGTMKVATTKSRWKVRFTGNEQPLPNNGGLYQGLLNVDPPICVQKLSEILHWDRPLPDDSGQSTTLLACLERLPYGTDRRKVIYAYWAARECVARYQACNDYRESLRSLMPQALSLREVPGGAAAMLTLQSSRHAARAQAHEEHAQLLVTQFELTNLAAGASGNASFLPSSPPYAGPVPKSTQANANNSNRDGNNAAELAHAGLEKLAQSMVYGDEARAELATSDSPSAASLNAAVSATERQLRLTQNFLANLTDYNRLLADKALQNTGALAQPRDLVKMLMVDTSAPAKN
jgi:hypothetical protein